MQFSKLAYDIAEEHRLLRVARVQERFHQDRLNSLLLQWGTSAPCPALLQDLLDEVARKAMVGKEERC